VKLATRIQVFLAAIFGLAIWQQATCSCWCCHWYCHAIF